MPDMLSSRHLVAPELLPALELLPQLELNDDLLAIIRATPPGEGGIPMPALTPEQRSVRCEARFAPGRTGAPDVRMLVYTPPSAAAGRPAYLHFHGGGFVMGMPEINDAANRDIALAQGCTVVSVDYRLAPEARWSDSYEDGYAALAWLHGEADALGVDAARIAIGGESAGGGHAAALALLARDRGEYPICFQLLDCPMLDDRTAASHDPHPYAGEFVWTPGSNRYAWHALLGQAPGGDDVPVAAVPARAIDLSGLPPTFIAIGALDLFLEESLEYARRLTRAGVPIELHVTPGAFHGYSMAGPSAPQIQTLTRRRHDALARAFATR
jgi:acetyl esterase/lipase